MEPGICLTLFATAQRSNRPESISGRRWLPSLLLLIALGTGTTGVAHAIDSDGTARGRIAAILDRHQRSGQQALRVAPDTRRGRLWVLGLQDVFVYDAQNGQEIRRIALPAWSVAGIVCGPGMALAQTGSAFVISNAEPRLWKIDADDFSIREHPVLLSGRESRDGGFGALTIAADGSLFALSSFGGALWRIEPETFIANAIKLTQRISGACALRIADTRRSGLTLCAASSHGTFRLELAADNGSAQVSRARCDDQRGRPPKR